jgi:6-phospho-3-hexuloisomerase
MGTSTESSLYIIKNIEEVLSVDQCANVEKMVDLITKAKKIFIYGVGRSGLVGKAFAIRLVQMGLKVFFIGETITPIVEKDDMVIIISNTGETMSAIQTANIARRVGSTVVAVTSNDHSKLAHATNLVICLKPKKDDKNESLAPLGTLFEASVFLFLDGLVALLMEILGKSETDMRRMHAIWV